MATEFTGYLSEYGSFPVLVDGQGQVRWAHWRYKRSVKPSQIVVHYTAGGTFDSIAIYLSKANEREVSIHFVIGRKGELAMICPLDWIAYHAGNWDHNVRSIGIELVHADDDSPYPEPQLEALTQLCRKLCALFDIPITSIIGHRDIVQTICPRNLDLDMVRARVAGQQPVPKPQPSPIAKSEHLYGVHEGPVDWLDGVHGWFVDTVNVWWASEGKDYSSIIDRGHTVIARLNNGYGDAGTLPLPHLYDEFAQQVELVVSRTPNCHIWQIGNEMNHEQERPDGQPILPQPYAACYAKCRARIHQVPGHEHDEVAIGAVAPWNPQTTYAGNPSGDWVRYFLDVIREIRALKCPIDAITLHAYTHTHNPDEVTSETKMNAPFGNRCFYFRAYRDFLEALPADLHSLPIYITEADPSDSAWSDVNNGYVRKLYDEIDLWDQQHPKGPHIWCLILYRGKDVADDKWYFADKAGVRQDWEAAKQHRYTNR